MPKQYKLPYIMKEPSEETEDMYLAEVPLLPGCRAWGATADEALFNLEGVAADFIASCEDYGDTRLTLRDRIDRIRVVELVG